MNYVQTVLNEITLTNKSIEFCQLLKDFLHNIEEMRLKLEAMVNFKNEKLFLVNVNYTTLAVLVDR